MAARGEGLVAPSSAWREWLPEMTGVLKTNAGRTLSQREYGQRQLIRSEEHALNVLIPEHLHVNAM